MPIPRRTAQRPLQPDPIQEHVRVAAFDGLLAPRLHLIMDLLFSSLSVLELHGVPQEGSVTVCFTSNFGFRPPRGTAHELQNGSSRPSPT